LGRYSESDPIGLEGGSDSYGYVAGNPLRMVEPQVLLRVHSLISGHAGFANVTRGIEELKLYEADISAYLSVIPGLTREQVEKAFEKDSGPWLHPQNLHIHEQYPEEKAYGRFDPLHRDIIFRSERNVLHPYEYGVPGSRMLLDLIIKHELAHYFANLTGMNLNDKYKSFEEGHLYEYQIYGNLLENSRDHAKTYGCSAERTC